MKLTILGNSGPYPRAGSACSGYLLETKNKKILIDCGNGTLSRLLTIIGNLNNLDAIILSHLHSDHMSDIMVMRYALGLNNLKSIPLYAPKDPEQVYNKLQFKDAFIQHEINENTKLAIGEMKISFKSVSHPVTTYGVIINEGSKKFVYTSDTMYCEELNVMAQNADLLLSESNLLEKDKSKGGYHLSAKEVGQLAKKNKVKKLLLTHIWPEYNVEEVLNEARINYTGDVHIASELKSYEI